MKRFEIGPAERRVGTWRRFPGETVHEALWDIERERVGTGFNSREAEERAGVVKAREREDEDREEGAA